MKSHGLRDPDRLDPAAPYVGNGMGERERLVVQSNFREPVRLYIAVQFDSVFAE